MAVHYLEFEKPIADLEAKIEELNLLSSTSGSFDAEVEGLRQKAEQLRKKTYAGLDPWMKTQVARHPQRACRRAGIGNREPAPGGVRQQARGNPGAELSGPSADCDFRQDGGRTRETHSED